MTRLMPAPVYRPVVTAAPNRRPASWTIAPPPMSPVTIDEGSRTLVRPSQLSTVPTMRQAAPTPVSSQLKSSQLKGPVQNGRASASHRDGPLSPDSIPPVAMSSQVPRVDMPGTIITARSRGLSGRPTAIWAGALVAMGVLVGLGSSLVARGETDSFVDQSSMVAGSHAASQVAAQIVPSTAPAQMAGFVSPQAAPQAEAIAQSGPANGPVAVSRPEHVPVAYAAPRATFIAPAVRHAAPRAAAPAPAPATEAKLASAEAKESAKDAVKEVKEKDPKPALAALVSRVAAKAHAKRGASDDDMESASAADALAKAQLEAALR